jgi:hypothetical protein
MVQVVEHLPSKHKSPSSNSSTNKQKEEARHGWLTPVIPVIGEAEIKRIPIQGSPRKIVFEAPISKITRAK